MNDSTHRNKNPTKRSIGSEDQAEISKIARIVIEEMGLTKVDFKFTGGVDGGRGLIGEV